MGTRRQGLARRRASCGFTQESFAHALDVDRRTVQRWEGGRGDPQPWQRPRMARLLRLTLAELDRLLTPSGPEPLRAPPTTAATAPGPDRQAAAGPGPDRLEADDELDALELARRVHASDVGAETLGRLERAFDDLASSYPTARPHELLARVRRHTAYVRRLLDARTTLGEHRRLLVVGGWLTLFAATLDVDLMRHGAAAARLSTAATLAREADHREIEAWVYETSAWRALTRGDYAHARDLSRRARHVAPAGSSAEIQATAQEGRARARLGESKGTLAAIDRVQRLAATLPMTAPAAHHYQYDPAKSLAYTATTLAWLGDAAAETYAREVIARLTPTGRPGEEATTWPRRLATAHLDLALALLAGDRLDEACDAALRAMLSGRLQPSNHWRALEIVTAVESHHLPEAADLREAYELMRHGRV